MTFFSRLMGLFGVGGTHEEHGSFLKTTEKFGATHVVRVQRMKSDSTFYNGKNLFYHETHNTGTALRSAQCR